MLNRWVHGFLWSTLLPLLVSCGGTPPIPDPVGFAQCVARCQAPGFCVHGAGGWSCLTPSPTPAPTPSPSPTAPPTPPPPADCRTLGCPAGEECLRGGRCGGADCFECFPIPTPTPTPTPAPTPQPTPTPCIPTTTTSKVCVAADGGITPFDRTKCWTCDDWQGYMIRNGYFTAGDPKEDGDASGTHPGRWLNYDPQGVLVGTISKRDCTNANGALVVDWPRAEVRTVATPCPSPTPTPGPTPTPAPGCPALFKVGGMFLTATDCGQNCRKQGYLGVRVNYTATELCREGDPGCVCDPARNRCEMPRQCQNPNGADTFITLAGHFTNDECDRNSDNFFNCHHKPKANEAGVTLFTSTPWQEPKNPWDPRGVTNCVDVQEHGTKQIPRDDPRCKAALAAAGR